MKQHSNRVSLLIALLVILLGALIFIWSELPSTPGIPPLVSPSSTSMLMNFSLSKQAQYPKPYLAVQAFILPSSPSVMIRYEDGTIEVRSMRSFNIETVYAPMGTSTLSPDGRLIASERLNTNPDEGSRITIWSLTDPTVTRVLTSADPIAEDVAWYPDNAHIVVTSQKDIILRRIADNAVIWRQQADADAVREIEMSPDGSLFFTYGQTNRLCVWGVADGKIVYCLAHQGSLAAFSPDSRVIAILDATRTIRLWESHSGAYIGELQHTDENLSQILFDPRGMFLIAGSSRGTVLCWRLADRRLISNTPITTVPGTIRTLILSQEPALLFVGDGQPQISFWRVDQSYE